MAELQAFPAVTPPQNDDVFQVLRPSRFHSYQHEHSTIENAIDQSRKSSEKSDRRKLRPGSYEALGLSLPICKALQTAGYNFPTPIQRKVIPRVLSGDDVVAMARTGSGKTAAFLAPLLHRLSENPKPLTASARRNGPRALVIAPTRELVLQELKFCKMYSKFLNHQIRSAVVVGGTPLEAQFEALAVCPEIVFATPGRLLQILAEMGVKGGLTLTTTETLVFDEADRLFEGTLAVETSSLIDRLRDRQTESFDERQTVLVSATMPHALAEFSRTGLRKSLSVIRLNVDKSLPPTLATSFISSRGDLEKDAALQVVIRRIFQEEKSVVVFAATHRRVEYLTELLRKNGFQGVGCVHGVMDQVARQETVAAFRKGKLKTLVVTDVAARGIDLPELDVVVNYDMPATPKLFVHRVGRVGRAGRFGIAVNLVSADELPYMLDTFLFVGQNVVFAEGMVDKSRELSSSFSSNAFCMETSFVFGLLPKSVLDEEVELVRTVVESVELSKAYNSARNAHKLYLKTRGTPSGESVRRAKKLLNLENGGRRTLHVHPWFADLESDVERAATEHVSQLSTWRPKDCAVNAPAALLGRKEVARAREAMEIEAAKDAITPIEEDAQTEAVNVTGDQSGNVKKMRKEGKISSRQVALEEERRQFFLPRKQDSGQRLSQKALKVRSGGAMGDDFSAFRELNNAAMDVNADNNVDLLRAKHTGGSSAKYWDRVTKKFVKGGVTDRTSKQNLHVASREAKAKSKSGEGYGTEDGVMFKRWLSKNRKAVEELAEQVGSGNENGEQSGVARFQNGLGSNDFRKGAYGRRARIAAAAKLKASGGNAGYAAAGSHSKAQPELKTAQEIKKERKMKARAEARRLAIQKGKKMAKRQHNYKPPQRGSSKIRAIIRRK